MNSSWVTITREDGLGSSLVSNVFEDSQGRIWAGTSTGISLYFPNSDRDPPETIIPSDKNVYKIAYDGDAQFVFTGIDKWKYTEKQRLLYSHRISKGAWSPFTTDTIANYQNLQPGRYQFDVRAMDRNWNIDPTPASFSI